MAGESTTKFEVDISQLKKGMQEAARQVRLANSEFKAATSGMDNWGKSADGVSAKIKQLDSVLSSQNKQLENLQRQYELVAKEEGETSKGAQELLIKINNQKAAIGKTENELNKWKKALSEISSEQREVVSATDKLKNSISDQESELADLKKKYTDLVLTQGKSSKEAKQTAKAIRNLSSELSDSKTALSNAEKAADNLDDSLDKVEESAKEAGDGFTVLKGAIANLVASGVKTIASSFVEMAANSREYRNEMAKLDTAFQTNGFSAETAKKTYKDFYAVLGDEGQAVEAVNHLSKLTKNEKDLATWTDIATGVYAQFGASLPIEGLTEAANETAKVGQVTGPLADALNWAGISEEKFNEKLEKCSNEQERQKLIMETLNKTYSKASDHYKETNKDVMEANKAQAELTEAYAKLGEKAEPVITAIKKGMADLLNRALELAGDVDFSEIATKIQDGFSYFIDTVLPKIKEGFQFIKDNKDPIIAGIVGIGTAFLAWKVVGLITSIVGAIKSWKLATEGLTISQKILNLIMSMNPIGIVISLIAGLVAAFIYLWNTSDEFREFWIKLWEKIKAAAKVAIEAVSKFFSEAWTKTKEAWGKAKSFFSDLWSNIKKTFSNVASWFGDIFGRAWTAIKNKFAGWGEFWSGLWTKIKNKFKDIGTNIGSAISSAIKGGLNRVLGSIERTINKGIGLINSAIDFANKLPGVKVGKVPKVSLPRLYQGGILKKGEVGLLEGRGDEAVVPLHNNKKWIRKTSQDLKKSLQSEGILGGGSGGKTITNNYNFNQTNNSPKALSRFDIYRQTRNQLELAKGV